MISVTLLPLASVRNTWIFMFAMSWSSAISPLIVTERPYTFEPSILRLEGLVTQKNGAVLSMSKAVLETPLVRLLMSVTVTSAT